MGIKFVFENGDKLGRQLKTNTKLFSERQVKAVQATANRAKDEIEFAGRANIREGGKFGSRRWQEGLQAKLSFQSRNDIRIRLTHAVSYWKVFEFGATIRGKPMLWIPLSFGNAFGVRARDYPGKLFRVNRPGKAPLLMDENGPQYFGKQSVTIPQKWHLRDVVKQVSRRMSSFYKEAMRNGR
jgi:hypothetical protein